MLDIIIEASKELNATIRRFGKLNSYRVTSEINNQKIIELNNLDTTEEQSGDIQLF
jgi:hypothetical protein